MPEDYESQLARVRTLHGDLRKASDILALRAVLERYDQMERQCHEDILFLTVLTDRNGGKIDIPHADLERLRSGGTLLITIDTHRRCFVLTKETPNA